MHIESGSAVEIIERFEHPAKDNTAMELNGNSLTSKQLVPSATIGRLVWLVTYVKYLLMPTRTTRFW